MFEGPMVWQSIIVFLFHLFELACCIAIVIRFWGSAAGLLGGVAFGTFFMVGMVRTLLHQALIWGWAEGEGAYWIEWLLWEHGYILMLINLVAYGCLFAAIVTAPVNRGGDASYRSVSAGPISKGFYLGSILGGSGVSIVFSVVSMFFSLSEQPFVGLAIVGLGMFPLIYGVVIFMVLVYKMWAMLEGKGARTTPGKAVGFLFIPFFNIYWVFQAYWGWAKDFNAYIDQQNIDVPRMSEGLALSVCVVMVLSAVPVIGLLLALVSFILTALFLSKVCDAMNALASVEKNVSSGGTGEPGLGGLTQ